MCMHVYVNVVLEDNAEFRNETYSNMLHRKNKHVIP